MPKIVKQTTKLSVSDSRSVVKTTKKTGTVFDRIAPVEQVDSGGIKLSLYGRSKTGKTRLIATFPKPVLIIGAEDGTRSIRNVKGVDFVLIKDSKEVLELASGAVDAGYATVAVDTASALADKILAEIMGVSQIPAQKSWGMATREQYGQQSLQLKSLLREVLNLPTNVIITAHERNFNEDGNGSDLLLPTVGSALSPSVTGWLNGAAEYIAQTFIQEATEEKEVKVGTKTLKSRQKTGGAEYCLRIGPHPVYTTGFRLPEGFELPDFIVNPDYNKIMAVINGG